MLDELCEEADIVPHCGGSLAGDFIWSLTCTDILSGRTEGGSVCNKGAAGVLATTREVVTRGRFAISRSWFSNDRSGNVTLTPFT
jgi:hypothetical protein